MLCDTKKYLTRLEIGESIERLSDADWMRLKKFASWFSRKCGLPEEDILQKSFEKALDGSRKCPIDVGIMSFLRQTMRSIASSNAKSYMRNPTVSLQNLKYDNGSDYQADLKDDLKPEMEAAIFAKMDLAKVKEVIPQLFESDPEQVQLLVMGILDEMDTDELKEFSGLNGKKYDSARRLFRRRVEKKFPGGYGNE